MKIGDKVKIIGPCHNNVDKKVLKHFFPDKTGYITYIGDGNIVKGKKYVIIHPVYKDDCACGFGYLSEHLEVVKPLPCPHMRMPMNGQDGWRHCPHCLGINNIKYN